MWRIKSDSLTLAEILEFRSMTNHAYGEGVFDSLIGEEIAGWFRFSNGEKQMKIRGKVGERNTEEKEPTPGTKWHTAATDPFAVQREGENRLESDSHNVGSKTNPITCPTAKAPKNFKEALLGVREEA